MRQFVAQRRDLTVFFGRQAVEPSVARVHDEHLTTGLGHRAHKVAHKAVALDAVNADAVFDGDGHIDHVAHGFDAIGHGLRLVHQTRAESAALHPVGGATAVQIDFVVAPLRAQTRGVCQVVRVAATKLQSHRVLFGVEAQMALHIAVGERTGRHHLGVEQGVAREQAVEKTAMAIGPVHHGRDRQAPGTHRVGGFRHRAIIPAPKSNPAEAGLMWTASLRSQ